MKTMISKYASMYGDQIKLGPNNRVDDFTIMTGYIHTGNNVHVAAYAFLSGHNGKILIGGYVSVGIANIWLTGNDDASGLSMVNPNIPRDFKPKFKSGNLIIENHAYFGANVVVLPDVRVGEGAMVGAFSLVNRDLEPWKIYAGVPAKPIKDRSKDVIDLARRYEEEVYGGQPKGMWDTVEAYSG